MENYNEYLTDLVKAAGQELIDRAADFVGNGDMISDFTIWIRFPQDNASFPEIEVQRQHVSKRAIDICHDYHVKRGK